MRNLESLVVNVRTFTEDVCIEEVVAYLENTGFSHAVILNTKGQFLGMISLQNMLSMQDRCKSVKEMIHVNLFFYTDVMASVFDVLSTMIAYEATVIPVLQNEEYLGIVTPSALLKLNDELSDFYQSATTIVVSKGMYDYSFSEIAQIVESHHAKLVGIFLEEIKGGQAEVVVKYQTPNANEIIQTFRRYDYEIISKGVEDDYTKELTENSKYLEKYLSV